MVKITNQLLEQIVEYMPQFEKIRKYETIDKYTKGTLVLYTPQPKTF
ncbi:MAG: hypothetical protein QXU20_00105 [Candidatus Woesearchaeota archaeon]